MLLWKRNHRKLGLKCDDLVHPDVEGLCGDGVNTLKVKADTDAFHLHVLAEKTVVVTLTASQPVSLSVKGYARDDDEVEITSVRLVLRFQNVEVAHGKSGVLAVFHGDDVVADHGGQDDGLLEMPFLKECLCLHLVGQGTIEHYLLGFDEFRMLFQLGQNLIRLVEKLFFGMLFFQALDVGSQFFFVHRVKFVAKVRNKLENT